MPPAPTVSEATNGGSEDEFENAVTTAIPSVMVQAIDHDLGSPQLDDVEIDGAELLADTLPADDDDLLSPGFLLKDRFEIVGVVHSGRMSSVYKAIDRRRHVDGSGQVYVAIKLMRSAIASAHNGHLKLEREAARAQRLSHPNVVNVFDFDEHEGRFFLVMEWLEGETVMSLLKRTTGRQLDRSFVWQIIEGTAAGVQHAHRNNVVHADINPGNIFITATHEIKLLDFGVARNWGERFDAREERLLWATKAYASPDVLSGIAPVVDDDIFSLGCVAYRLLSGSHPFPGADVLKAKHEQFEPAPIPGLSENEWQTVQRALAYARTERPKSAAVFFRNTLQLPPMELEMDSGSGQTWRWLVTTLAVLAVIAAGFWWLRENQALVFPQESADAADESRTVPDAIEQATSVAAMLATADAAMADARYVEPANDNARDHYRDVLAVEPNNPVALRGLRDISDLFVQQAESALRADSLVDSSTALNLAAETDPDNPATEFVRQLLVAEGNQQLAAARAAALSGDLERATAILGDARQYPSIDAGEIASIQSLISVRGDEADLLAQLAVVGKRIDDGRLIAPAGDNARDSLLALRAEHAGDSRLQSATYRLGDRLLTNAAFATTAGEYRTAGELLDAVESLGILGAEVETARSALASARAQPELANTLPVAVAGAAGVAAGSTAATPAAAESSDQGTDSPSAPDPGSEGETIASGSDPQARRKSLSDLGIQEYVAPKYPRTARRRNLSGYVDVGFVINTDGSTGEFAIIDSMPGKVFDASAEKAVSRWQFAPRDEPVSTRIVLSFEATP